MDESSNYIKLKHKLHESISITCSNWQGLQRSVTWIRSLQSHLFSFRGSRWWEPGKGQRNFLRWQRYFLSWYLFVGLPGWWLETWTSQGSSDCKLHSNEQIWKRQVFYVYWCLHRSTVCYLCYASKSNLSHFPKGLKVTNHKYTFRIKNSCNKIDH